MQVKVLFDKEAKDKGLHTGWGVSFLVNDEVLFDTGEKGSWLLDNMKMLGVDKDRIKTVVISHQHWDHTGGLWDLLNTGRKRKVYVCSGFGREFKEKVKNTGAELIETKKLSMVGEDIFVTAPLEASYKGILIPEQALLLRTDSGLVVITGCAHPGIVNILKRVKEEFPSEKLRFVFGGFHLMDKDRREIKIIVERLKEMEIAKIGPTHCAGYEAQQIFKDAWEGSFIFIKVGMEFTL